MLVVQEMSLNDFDTWSGANSTKDELTYDELNTLDEMLTEMYPDGMTDTEINDFLWFDTDTIAEWLGYADWEDLEEHQEERYTDCYGQR